jgi:hypothetical protein
VKNCKNRPAPSGKAKYSQKTDSELVPWGKGEKNSYKESEIDFETVSLQAVEAIYIVTACLLHNEPTSYSFLAKVKLFT